MLVDDMVLAVQNVDADNLTYRSEFPNGNGDKLLSRLECMRATWEIALDSRLLDRYFNGLMGLRAQYYISPFFGRHQNHVLLQKLKPSLLDAVGISDLFFAERSLENPSAKAWISEKSIDGKSLFDYSVNAPDSELIQNDWQYAAEGIPDAAGIYSTNLYSRCYQGVQAPIPDRLQIKGAWLTTDFLEYIEASKRDRDIELFMFGFS